MRAGAAPPGPQRARAAGARRRWLAGVPALALAAALLPGCGFALRGGAPLRFQRIALVGFAPRSTLAQALRRELARRVQVVDDPAQAEVVLRALQERRDRSVVATTAAAQVRELQLRLAFDFRAQTPDGRVLLPRAELLLARDLGYNETAALAKAQEDAELFREMEDEVVVQVLRRLAAITL
jgi:LPS-assembly lipoprotein